MYDPEIRVRHEDGTVTIYDCGLGFTCPNEEAANEILAMMEDHSFYVHQQQWTHEHNDDPHYFVQDKK